MTEARSLIGQREVPGRQSLYGTTRAFLDYYNLKSLDQLPPLPEIRALIETMVLEEAVREAGAGAGRGAGTGAAGAADPDDAADSADTDDVVTGEMIPEDFMDLEEAAPATGEDALETDEPAPHLADVVILPNVSRE
jgi:segregation and condensation protein B